MPSYAEMARDDTAPNVIHPVNRTKLPSVLRFPLVVIISLSISTFAYSTLGQMTEYELSTVSRHLNNDWAPAAILGWRIFELGVGWFGQFDDIDIAALTTLTHSLHLYLLYTFYAITPTTILASLAIDILTSTIPTRLLRQRSAFHNPRAPRSAVPNAAVIHAPGVRISTTLAATALYALALYAAQCTFLPTYLVTHFDGLRTLELAHAADQLKLLPLLLPVGYAARAFLLTPALGVQNNLADIRAEAFNPATASLGQTVRHNLWGYRKATKTLIRRTVVLVFMTALSSVFNVFASVEGSELEGALGYAGVWIGAGVLSAIMFGWMGDV